MKRFLPLNRLNISTRLIIVTAAIFFAILIISVITVMQSRDAARITEEIFYHPYTVSNAIGKIETNIVAMHRSMKDVALSSSENELNQAVSAVNDYEQRVLENFKIVFDRFLGEKSNIDAAYNAFIEWRAIRNEVIELTKKGDHEAAYAITKGKGARHVDLMFAKITDMVEYVNNKATQYRIDALSKYDLITKSLIIFISTLIVISASLVYFTVRSITLPINEIIHRIQDISRNQFHVEIDLSGKNQMNLLIQSVDQLENITEKLNKEIEERKKVQSELELYKNSLEKLVEKRTRELQEAQALLSKAVDDADIGMVLVKPDGQFKRVNGKFCEIMGYSTAELLQKTFQEITHPEDYDVGNDVVRALIEGKSEQAEFKKRYIRKNGEVIHVQIFTVLLHDEQKKPLYFFTQVQNITEQVVNSDKMIDYSKNLESLVLQRTHELEDKAATLEKSQQALSFLLEDVNDIRTELERANRRYEQTNKELESFSYSVSHDLRAPLRGIDGFSQILMEDYSDKLDREGLQVLNRIRNASKRMSRLIDDLLSLSRITRQSLHKVEVDLSKLTAKVFEHLTSQKDNSEVQINIREGMTVWADEALLQIALTNLLENAIKFTGKVKKPEIEVGVIRKKGKNTFFIRDNGAGFDMKFANKLFNPFQRLHSDVDYPGTGIGLATVQRVIHRHGGKVWAESKIAQGTTIFFIL